MKTILVDMDDTIANYSKKMAEELAKVTGDETIDHSNWFKLEGIIKHQKGIQRSDGFYHDLEPVPFAIDALKEMVAEGYDVFIVSSPSGLSRTCHSDKNGWIRRYLGDEWIKRLVLTKDKTIIRGDILIDDKAFIRGSVIPMWEQVIFDRPFNSFDWLKSDLDGTRYKTRLFDWRRWREVI